MGSRILKYDCMILRRQILGGKVLLRDCDPHFHDTYTIGLVRRGTVRLTIGTRVFRVEPGDVFVVHP